MAQKRAFQFYMTAVCVSGIAFLISFAVFYPIYNIFSAVFFAVLAIVAETQTVCIGNGKFISVSSAIVTATMLTSGPTAAVLTAVVCVLGSVTKNDGKTSHVFNTKVEITLFNISNYALSSAVMCLIYFRFGGGIIGNSHAPFAEILQQISGYSVQMIIGVVISIILNSILVAGYISIKNKTNIFSVLAPNFAWPVTSVIFISILGVLLTALYVAYGWFLVVLFFLPFMLARYTFTTYKNLQQNYLQTVDSLASAIETKDVYTSGHSRRVEQYSEMIAGELKLSVKRRETLKYAALLHDIGKIGIPERILNKHGKLDESEWEYIKSHSEKGAHIIEDIEFLKDAVEIVRCHHEWYDGSGYPGGLSEKDLSMEAMIICVADSYDAMTSDRPYREKFSDAQAMKELHDKAGKQFSPQVVDAFERALIKNGELTKTVG
jgi:putative nucleotidyltransferase with HDIG domain